MQIESVVTQYERQNLWVANEEETEKVNEYVKTYTPYKVNS